MLVSLAVFLLLRIIPGDPAQLILAGTDGEGSFTPQELLDVQRELGTDKPIHVQYGTWIWELLRGDLGSSYFYKVPIVDQLKQRIPLTLQLAAMSIIMSFMIALPLGIISAIRQDTIPDYIARQVSFAGIAIPTFVIGLVTVYLLVRLFNWIPPLDYTPPWDGLGTNLQQLIFPAIALSSHSIAFVARVTRSSMLEVLREDYIRTARAKGLRERQVIYIHALRNAFLPVITITGWVFGVSLGGTVILERIFVLPGLGKFLLDSILLRDYLVVQNTVMLVALMVLVVNLMVDLLYAVVDPRIRLG